MLPFQALRHSAIFVAGVIMGARVRVFYSTFQSHSHGISTNANPYFSAKMGPEPIQL